MLFLFPSTFITIKIYILSTIIQPYIYLFWYFDMQSLSCVYSERYAFNIQSCSFIMEMQNRSHLSSPSSTAEEAMMSERFHREKSLKKSSHVTTSAWLLLQYLLFLSAVSFEELRSNYHKFHISTTEFYQIVNDFVWYFDTPLWSTFR